MSEADRVSRTGGCLCGGVRYSVDEPLRPVIACRGFGPVCGANLFFDGPGENLSIFAGTLDMPTGLALAGHIYCAEKGDYYDLTDDLPHADGPDPDLTTMVEE